ncbi:MAG TPA: GNAT family N-acetyltransferase [Candidatus Deferrimicrobium sp.]|nr:GNAT family N-acetyltransferase [Candidatus Deferrimicrobium sp.]
MVRLSSEPTASPDELARVTDSLDRWNMETTGVRDYHPIAIFLRDDEDEIRGGVTGGVWGGWLHIVGLWIDDPFRGRGLGRKLVLAAEAEARTVGARRAFLETHSFQAPGLYLKLGYVVFAEIEDYPPGASEMFLRKDLVDEVASDPGPAPEA